jgi:hypothetical protein
MLNNQIYYDVQNDFKTNIIKFSFFGKDHNTVTNII